MITDYDCWKIEEEPVTAETVVAHLHANAEAARAVIAAVIPKLPVAADWPEHRALEGAIMTARELWPEETVARLATIIGGR